MKIALVVIGGNAFRLYVASRGENYVGVLIHGDELEVIDGDLVAVMNPAMSLIENINVIIVQGTRTVAKYFRLSNGWVMLMDGNVKMMSSITLEDLVNVSKAVMGIG